MRRKAFWKIFVERLIMAAVLVLITYNIWGMSYYHWIMGPFAGLSDFMSALKILSGILLAVLYIALVWATWRAKGPIGIMLMFIVLGACVYVAWAGGLIDFKNPHAGTIVAQIIIMFALAIGSTWSIFWRRVTGQIAVEDPDTTDAHEA